MKILNFGFFINNLLQKPSGRLLVWQRQLPSEPLAIERNTLQEQFRIKITLPHPLPT